MWCLSSQIFNMLLKVCVEFFDKILQYSEIIFDNRFFLIQCVQIFHQKWNYLGWVNILEWCIYLLAILFALPLSDQKYLDIITIRLVRWGRERLWMKGEKRHIRRELNKYKSLTASPLVIFKGRRKYALARFQFGRIFPPPLFTAK